MSLLKLAIGWIKSAASAAQDILVPENNKIQKLLDLPAGTLRDLLPKSPVYMKDIFVLFDYQNKIVRFIVKSIKYKNNASLRKRIAGYLYEETLDISSETALFDGASPLLMPIPMSKKEKMDRGFNQCEELCREIKRLSDNNIEISFSILKKVRETERQAKLSREKRLINIENSMAVPTESVEAVRGRVVIILDDVYTTGASLAEARRALLSAGAKRVIGIFIAH